MKILAVSDIHIHDYTSRCPKERQRLYQSRVVAQNIIKVGHQEGAEVIVFAGDIIEKSLIRPYIQAEAKLFLDTIMKEFKYGFIILGNHDLDSKDSVQTEYDSCLGIMLPENLYYADGKMSQLGSSLCAFSNWKPKFDLGWIQNPVDVLFTHITVDYSGTGMIKSQKIDQSKFNLAICGDIHYPATKGRFVSIGVPQKCKMGDSDKATGVIYDTEAKSWYHVDLNPDDNLLKFQYTKDLSREGYSSLDNTYYVYKPDYIITRSGVNEIQIPAWGEIQELIDRAIHQSGLEKVHSEILSHCKNEDFQDLDFMFTPVRFACQNWRSIDDLEIFFERGDKFFVRGRNGSGKSSLLSALKYALIENRSIKDFIQAGQKECWAELEFIYQEKRYCIRRGSKQWGLIVDGQQMTYPNKKTFEEDAHHRFPFIDYLDIFFFDEDHLRLIGDLSPERKSDVISKFYKINRVDCYNRIASEMYAKILGNSKTHLDAYTLASREYQVESKKIENFQIPTRSLEELESEMKKAIDLQNKFNLWNQYQENEKTQADRIVYLNNQIKFLSDGIIPTQELEAQKTQLSSEIEQLELNLKEISGNKFMLNSLNKELAQILSDGRETQGKLDKMERKTCPICNKPMDEEHYQKHFSELTEKRNSLLSRYNEISGKIQSLSNTNLDESKINQELKEKRDILFNISSEITRINNNIKQISQFQTELNNLNSKTYPIPEKIVLPDNFIENTANIQRELSEWKFYQEVSNRLSELMETMTKEETIIEKNKKASELLEKYITLTSSVGKIYQEIMEKLSTEFSDGQVKYEVSQYTFRGKDHLDLVPYYYNNGNWFSYQSCSSGQKTFLDINFLSKIITGCGFMIMDEFLKSLDPENHDVCLEVISGMNVSCTLLSSHMETLASFNNKTLSLNLNQAGMTCITNQ